MRATRAAPTLTARTAAKPSVIATAMLVGACTLSGCDAASSDPALDAWLQIAGAQWRPGPLPDDASGPAVVGVQTLRATVQPGAIRERFRGQLGIAARAVAIGLDGDRGSWIVPAAPPDSELPEFPSFDVRAQLSLQLPEGPIDLVVVAFDEGGRSGPMQRVPLLALAQEPPRGELVIALTWDGPADLDLHVVDALGGEAWSGDPNTWQPPPPGQPVPPEAWRSGGILDQDGNADCRRDGAPSEHVVWQQRPPAGDYTVRVDTRSMCGAAAASWRVSAISGVDRVLLGAVRGTSLPDDALQPHGRGAGVLALSFTIAAQTAGLQR